MQKTFLFGIVGAAMLASSLASASDLRICTGGEAGNYFFAGNVISKNARSLSIDVVTSQGSVENLDRMLDGSCDAAIVQSDALMVYAGRNPRILPVVERAASLYTEVVHLICNTNAKISNIKDLNNTHVIAVGDGTGTAITWEAMSNTDRDTYGKIVVDTRSGLRALNAAADGTDVTCSLFVSGLGSSLIKNDAQTLGDRLNLVVVDDPRFVATKDARGRDVYSFVDIDAKRYPRLAQSGWFSNKDTRTIGVDAVFVISTDWIKKNERAYDGLLRAVNASLPEIAQRVSN
jgi:uncharacterized protein